VKTLNEYLEQVEKRVSDATECYDGAGENREIAMANYTMGDEYVADVPTLIKMLRLAIEQRNDYRAYVKHFGENLSEAADDAELLRLAKGE